MEIKVETCFLSELLVTMFEYTSFILTEYTSCTLAVYYSILAFWDNMNLR